MKKKYAPPMLEVFEYTVERGFAGSHEPVFDLTDSLEDVREGKHYDLFGEDEWY